MSTKVICVVVPTAVGKTAFAVNLAQRYNGEIISGDSIQIYKELDIGSAKVTEEEKQGINGSHGGHDDAQQAQWQSVE